MLTPRGVSLSLAGVAMWFAARLIGSPGVEVVGIGLAALPFLAGFIVRAARRDLTVDRRLSDIRVQPGRRVTVDLHVRNASTRTAPLLLLEDHLPPTLGRPARLVVSDLRGRSARTVSYTVLPQARGHYGIGPLAIDTTDPFGLARVRVRLDEREELVVLPQVEDLSTPPDSASGSNVGSSRARQLLRSGDEYYTMRAYQQGDDLRRIHWPSVARTGDLMIRQDEATKRAAGVLFVDNRESALGQTHAPSFERVVSAAASVGMLLASAGFTIRLASSDTAAVAHAGDRFLDALAGLTHTKIPSLATSLSHVRASASADSSLVFVGAPPAAQELPTLLRSGAGFGAKLAILVHPVDPATAPPSRREQLQSRATQATLAISRAGWDCILLSPTTRLAERWHVPRERRLASNA
jgi:uncharacterized protein (DUF58 family)